MNIGLSSSDERRRGRGNWPRRPNFAAKDEALRRRAKPFFVISYDLGASKTFGLHLVFARNAIRPKSVNRPYSPIVRYWTVAKIIGHRRNQPEPWAYQLK
jgi:hypothetical protein